MTKRIFLLNKVVFLLALLFTFKSYGLSCEGTISECAYKETTLDLALCKTKEFLVNQAQNFKDRAVSTPVIVKCIFKNSDLNSNENKTISCSSTFKEVRQAKEDCRIGLRFACLHDGTEDETITFGSTSFTCKQGNWVRKDNIPLYDP